MSWTDEDSADEPELETLNISNDQYYLPISERPAKSLRKVDSQLPIHETDPIRHTLPAYDLWRKFYPTHFNNEKIRNFHRPKLRYPKNGNQRFIHWAAIKNLSRNIGKRRKRLYDRAVDMFDKGRSRDDILDSLFRITKASNLTIKDGDIALFEYSEEFPPVLNQPGMTSIVKTYIVDEQSSRKPKKTTVIPPDPVNFNFSRKSDHSSDGCNAQSPHSTNSGYHIGYLENIDSISAKRLYFNSIRAGSTNLMIENKLFRAPIFRHQWHPNDFLIVKTEDSYYVRQIDLIFTVGQLMTLPLIPEPRSISRFWTGLSNFHIFRQMLGKKSVCPVVDFDGLIKTFPHYQRKELYKRLRARGGRLKTMNGGSKFIFPKGLNANQPHTLRKLYETFTPEQYCLYIATLTARQRLRELNYTETMINPPEKAEIEIEVLAAPWNTSRAVYDFLADKCYLDLLPHLIDPTGSQREGFSCVRWVKSPTEMQQKDNSILDVSQRSKSITSREEILMKNPQLAQIRKEKLERLSLFNREAHLIGDVQTRILASEEVLSSDDESVSDDDRILNEENMLDTTLDEQLQDLDRLVMGGQTERELLFEKEEEERRKMLQEFKFANKGNSQPSRIEPKPSDNGKTVQVSDFKHKFLKITRTYPSEDGPITRTEIVRDSKIIALYVQQRGSKGRVVASAPSEMPIVNDIGPESQPMPILTSTPTKSCFRVKTTARRLSTSTLGPTELCRAEGLRLTISKSVLKKRSLRRSQRTSNGSLFTSF